MDEIQTAVDPMLICAGCHMPKWCCSCTCTAATEDWERWKNGEEQWETAEADCEIAEAHWAIADEDWQIVYPKQTAADEFAEELMGLMKERSVGLDDLIDAIKRHSIVY